MNALVRSVLLISGLTAIGGCPAFAAAVAAQESAPDAKTVAAAPQPSTGGETAGGETADSGQPSEVKKTAGPPSAEPLPEDYSCIFCHGDPDTFSADKQHLLVQEKDLVTDVHWSKGIRCHNCHGGSPDLAEFKDHRDDPSFHSLASPADIPVFCGNCHANIEYMRQYTPSPRTDQLAEYWTSGHGLRLKEDPNDDAVATCVSCHSHHDIMAVDNLKSPVYPTHVAKTCSQCHSDAKKMAGRKYHGRLLGHDQYELWSKSVHAKALLKDGDLFAPTCNDCHGNHGAVPPSVTSVANACGTCHVKIGGLFAKTAMKHRFEEVGLPGCATCHSNHDIQLPSDKMLGMTGGGVCAKCHTEKGDAGKYGATLAGTKAAEQMHAGLSRLKQEIAAAEAKLDQAETLGMEVRKPRFELREASDALTNARTLIHGFAVQPMKEALDQGLKVSGEVDRKAQDALDTYTFRRVWLAVSLVPILIVVGLLLLYIRSLPIPRR